MLNFRKVAFYVVSCLLLPFLLVAGNGKGADPLTARDFAGVWNGSEKCSDVSAKVATLEIRVTGNNEVAVSGFYSTLGEVKGYFKDGVITINKQPIPDPIFKNIFIQGTITLSKKGKLLNTVFTIQNNDARDQCSAIYHK
jgi:hypothetical protein